MLSSRGEARWVAAQKLFHGLIDKATQHDAVLMFDDIVIEPSQLKILPDRIVVESGNSKYLLFEADPTYDHGLHTSSREFAREMRTRFMVIKKLKW